ncbi:MAG: hypothetical protein P8Z35_09930 [Ignavibacteriaceae bacterium]|jgi:hypothetical protein
MENELLKKPEDFEMYQDTLMSNLEHTIDKEIEKKIKGQKFYAQYTGWNFYGYVWYNNNKWHCEVWRYNFHIETITKDSLEEIMEEVSSEYGSE